MFDFLRRKVSKEQRFWNWFAEHKVDLEHFIEADKSDYRIYHQMTDELKKYDALLFPVVTMSDEQYVLIITPDGMKDGVLPTQKLYDAKPEIENWVIKKFRQPKDEIELNYDGVEYPSSDIEIIPEIENEKIDIRVFIRNMELDEKRYQTLAWLYLDHILGEFNTITNIGYVDFYHLDENKSVEGGISLLEVRKLIDTELYGVK